MSAASLPDSLRQAAAAGLLRPLDLALAAWLVEAEPGLPEVVLALAALTSQQHGQGHLCLDLAQLRADPAAFGLDVPAADGLRASWSDRSLPGLRARLGLSAVIGGPAAGASPLVLDGDLLYLRRAWRDETDVAADLRARMRSPSPLAADADLRPVLDALFPDAANAGPDWQKVACALAARQRFTVITGGPGTGKTTTVVRLLGLLQALAMAPGGGTDAPAQAGGAREATRGPLRIALAAPTGKAAARLGESIAGAVAALPLPAPVRRAIPVEVATVHRLLGAQGGTRRFRHHAREPLPLDVLVIDEASMLDLELMAAVLRALPGSARLILLGDKDQLASVEAGAVLGDLCAGAEAGGYAAELAAWLAAQTGADLLPWTAASAPREVHQHVVMLRHSHRFDAGRGIGRLAADLRAGIRAGWRDGLPDWPAYAPEVSLCDGAALPAGYADYMAVLSDAPAAGAGDDDRAAWAAQVLAAFDRFRLLAAVRAGRHGVIALNAACEAHWRAAGRLPADAPWYAGRPVMVTRNDYGLGLMNGDIGITLWLPDAAAPGGRRLRVVFRDSGPGGGLRWLLPSRLPEVETVFAMTVHKAQGSEFDHAVLVLPEQPVPVLSRELVYTALTRAKRHIGLCLPVPALWALAAGRQALRSSGLRDRLP